MDNRIVLLNRIQNNLAFFAGEVKRNMEQRRTDILIDAEEIFRKLLNMLYGYDFKNANDVQKNYPAVDLIDSANHVAVNVCATITSAKIKQIMHTFEDHKLNDTYYVLMILVLGIDKISQRILDLRSSGYEMRIMNLRMLYEEIEYLPDDKVAAISRYLTEVIGADDNGQKSSRPAASAPAVPRLNLTSAQLQVLALASLLPDTGLDQRVFSHGLNSEQRRELPELFQNGFLYHTEGHALSIHPDIRSEFREELNASKVEYKDFLDRLWHYDKCWHWDRFTLKERKDVRTGLAQVFSTASQQLDDENCSYVHRGAELWLLVQEYAHALENGQYEQKKYESSGSPNWELARVTDFVGTCYSESKQYTEALRAWEKTLSLCRRLQGSAPDLATALHKVGSAHLRLKDSDAAKSYLMDELKIREELRRSRKAVLDQPGLKEVYAELSTVFANLGNNLNELRCSANALRDPAEMEYLWELLDPHLDLPLIAALPEDKFIGREQELAEIRNRFLAGHKSVIICGRVGCGKTELAVRYGQAHDGNVYYTRFDTSFTKTLANMALAIRPALDEEELSRDETELSRMVLNVLQEAGDRDLLIIDDVRWVPDLQRDPDYRALNQLPVRLLLTTQHDVPQGIHLGDMPVKFLYPIFRNHGVDLTVQDMNALIHAADSHIVTIDLMARMLSGKFGQKVNADTLLKLLRANAPAEGKSGRTDRDNHDPADLQHVFNNLKMLFQVSQMGAAQRHVLRYATLLPENGMDGGLFAATIPENEADALESLFSMGWLTHQDTRVMIHPVVRLICREELKPTDENCGDFLRILSEQWDRMHFDPVKSSQLAETFTMAADHLEDRDGHWIVKAGSLWNDLARYDDAVILYERHRAELEDRLKDHLSLAAVYQIAGRAYCNLGAYEKGLEIQLRAVEICQKNLPDNHPDLANAYDNIGVTYGILMDEQKALWFYEQAFKIRKNILPANHPDLAVSYQNMSNAFLAQGNYKKALHFQMQALEIRKNILPANHPDLAVSYDNLGAVYAVCEKPDKARECMLQALKIREIILPPYHPDLAASYINIGSLYGRMGIYAKAMEYLLKALEIRETILPANHPDLAASYNQVGVNYADLGDNALALEYFLKVEDIFEKILSADHPQLKATYQNIAYTYDAMGEPEKAMVYFRKAQQ